MRKIIHDIVFVISPSPLPWYSIENHLKLYTQHILQRQSQARSAFTHQYKYRPAAEKKNGNEHLSQNHAVLPTLLRQHDKRWTRVFLTNRHLDMPYGWNSNCIARGMIYFFFFLNFSEGNNEISEQKWFTREYLTFDWCIDSIAHTFFNVFFFCGYNLHSLCNFKKNKNWTLNTTMILWFFEI